MKIGITKTKFAEPCKCCLSENRGEVFTGTFIGVQDGLSRRLNLFKCDGCTTTRGQRVEDHFVPAKVILRKAAVSHG